MTKGLVHTVQGSKELGDKFIERLNMHIRELCINLIQGLVGMRRSKGNKMYITSIEFSALQKSGNHFFISWNLSSVRSKQMIEALWYKFIQTWFLGLVATFLGRYVGRTSVRFPETWGARCAVFFQIWGFTFLTVLAFGYAGYLFGFQEHTQAGFAEFLFPLIAGAYFGRQMLRRHMANGNSTRNNTP